MTNKVLITGSEGFIGKHLKERLRSNPNTEVWTLDTSGEGDHHFNERVENFQNIGEFDKIYHLAAISNPRVCERDKEKAWTINVEGTRNIVKQMNSEQTIVFSSSAHVYGKRDGKRVEEDRRKPDNFYGSTKKIAEEIIREYARTTEFTYNIYRLFNIFGPGQRDGFLVPDVIDKAENKAVVVVNDPHSKIAPLYIRDVIQIITKSLPEGVYNIAGECVMVKEVYDIICSELGSEIEVEERGSGRMLCGDSSKIESYIRSWTDLETALCETVRKEAS